MQQEEKYKITCPYTTHDKFGSMASSMLAIVFLVLTCFHGISCDSKVQASVSDGGKQGNPGAKVRVTQVGLNYISDIVRQQMAVIMPTVRLGDTVVRNQLGTATLTNMRVTGYKPPDQQTMGFQPPNQVVVVMRHLDVAVAGHVVASASTPFGIPLGDQADFNSLSRDIDVTYVMQVLRTPAGQFAVRTTSCNAVVNQLDLNLFNTGPLGQMLNAMRGLIANQIKPEIARQICAQGTAFFDNNANAKLAQIPTKMPLNDIDPERFAQSQAKWVTTKNPTTIRNSQGNRRGTTKRTSTRRTTTQKPQLPSGGFMLDYSNVKDPAVIPEFIETYLKGEISPGGQGGTPFYPNDFREKTPYPLDKMFYLVASDYLANSMLYHAFVRNLLKYHVSPDDTPFLADYLQTSCEFDIFTGSMCLGSLVPQIQETFPNSQAEIYIEATKQAPAVFFQPDGVVRIQAPVTVTLSAKKGNERKTMLVSDADVVAKTNLYIENQWLKGNLTVDKLDLKMRQNNLKNFNKDNGMPELRGSAKTIMEAMGNAFLKQGMPLPVVAGMQLRNTKVNVIDRAIRIDTDCTFDQAAVSAMVG